MKHWALGILLVAASATVKAQVTGPDTAFTFTHRISRSVNQWVVYPKNPGTDIYPFGFVYIDPNQGFVFNLEGFMIASGTRFTRIKQKIDDKIRDQYILKPGPKPMVAHIDAEHNVELDIYPRPSWLDTYTSFTDTAAHCVDLAKAYNGIQDSEMAAAVLQDVYKTAPHTPGLEVELAHAYNDLKRYNEAVKIAETALLADVGQAALYRELGNGQLGKGKIDDALSTYSQGMHLCDPTQADVKSEMAMYTAIAYRTKGNKEAYTKWIQFAKDWAPRNTQVSVALQGM